MEKLFTDKSTTIYKLNKTFRKLLLWATTNSTLQFNKRLYKQIDGVAMDSPLAPALADIFINWHLGEVQKKPNISFTIYRYVDDLLLAFDNQIEIDIIFNLFNSIHKNITLIQEFEENHRLLFLNVNITTTEENIETIVFKKPTHTGLYTKSDSCISFKYKQNLVLTLLDRTLNSAATTV